MARRPYKPDNVGKNSYPTNQSQRVGFDQQMKPVFGIAVDDVLLATEKRALEVAQYRNYAAVTNSNAEQGVIADETGDALTAALGVLDSTVAAWRWDGLSLKLPNAFASGVDALADIVNTVKSLLEAVLTILKLIEAAQLARVDALSAIVNAVKAEIEDVLGLFTGTTGVYALSVPLQAPPGPDAAKRVAKLEATTVNLREAVGSALGIGSSYSTSASDIRNRISAGVVPTAANKTASRGGMNGFIDTFEASLNDVDDLERPQLSSNAWVGGIIIVYGGTDLGLLHQKWLDLLALFGDFIGSNAGLDLPPAPTGLRVEALASATDAPKTAAHWDRPKVSFKLSGYYPAWQPQRDILYATKDLNTASPASAEWAAGIADFVKFHDRGKPVAAFERTRVDTDLWSKTYIDEDFVPGDAGDTWVYRVGRVYKKKLSSSLTSDFEVEVLSAPVSVLLPKERGASSGGIPPDWVSGRVSDFLPAGLVALIDELRVVLNQLLDLPVDTAGLFSDLVSSMVAEVEKWVALARRLNALLAMVRDLFNISAGFHALSFFGLGGNAFMVDVLKDSVQNAPASNLNDPTPVDGDASLSERLSERLEKTSFTDFVADNRVPKFGDEDTVGGLAFLAGDASMQAALDTYRIFQTLFGIGSSTSSTPELQYQVDVLLEGGGDGRAEPVFDAAFNIVGAVDAADVEAGSAFGEDMGVVTRHSDEGSAC